jgi:hypothetical protein
MKPLLLTTLAVQFFFLVAYGQSDDNLSQLYPGDQVYLLAPGKISTQMGEYSPTLDTKRNELYFMRRTPGVFDYTIYRSILSQPGWASPEVVSFSGQYRDAAPYLSPDGNTLLFDSRRPHPSVNSESISLWSTRRTAKGWEEPAIIKALSENPADEPEVGQDEFGPAIDARGNIYAYSFRQPYRGGARYLKSARDEEAIQLDFSIPDPSASTFVSYLYISPDGTFAVMEGRAKGRRDTDLFCSCKQADGKWTGPVEVPGVNTRANEGGPFITADGKFLLFTSNRRTVKDTAKNANLYLTRAKSLLEFCQRSR